MDGIGGDELVDVGGGPGGEGSVAVGEAGVVLQEGEALPPEVLPPLPVLPEEGLRFCHFLSRRRRRRRSERR